MRISMPMGGSFIEVGGYIKYIEDFIKSFFGGGYPSERWGSCLDLCGW